MLNKNGFTAIELMIVILLLVILPLAIIFFPRIAIWAVNTLVQAGGVSDFAIPVTFKTWFAMLFLMLVFGGSKASVSKKN